jgi:LCP family protein required for cell wall assembly
MNSNNLKLLLYSLMIALIIGITGMAFNIKNLNTDLNTKQTQINMLINELGEIKSENQNLYRTLVDNNNYNSKSFKTINDAYLNLKDYLEKKYNEEIDIKDEKLHALSIKYENVITEKEKALNNLKNKNRRLTEEVNVANKNNSRLNFLILGRHDNLTDTIILASVNEENETINVISIPRDLFLNGRKINSVYTAYGIEKVKSDIHTVTGIYPDRYIVVNMNSFKEIIDILGGVDLYVKKDIHDPYFPTPANGYTVYSIKEGEHHMSGEEALMYVRSRKTTSDFDRSERQHQVLQALRVKFKRLNLFEDLEEAKKLLVTVLKNIKTDADLLEVLYYINKYQNYPIKSGNVINTENFLYATRTSGGQYILLPKNNSFYNIKKQISELIND